MKVAVIIVTYNAKKWIESCLKPLSKPSKRHKVYIIDNGSTDGTQDIIKENYPEFIFYQSETNLGFGKANNLGLDMALKDGMDFFFLLNQDACISWTGIQLMAKILHENKEYGVLSPLHMFDNNKLDYLHYETLLNSKTSYFNDLITNSKINEVYEIKYTNAALWLISKDCLKKVGAFDNIFFHYGEDYEFSKRVNYFNFKLGLTPLIKGFHYRKQNVDRKKTMNSLLISFLTDLKDLKTNIFETYTKLFLKLLLGFFSKSKEKSSLLEAKAFFKSLLLFKEIRKSRNNNKIKNYCFLEYENE